jgi:hypothetical protein
MEILQKFQYFHKELSDLNNKFELVLQERFDWCNQNRALIKTLFPKVGVIYQIVDVKSLLPYYEQEDFTDEIYYFKVTDNRFKPTNNFTDRWNIKMYPLVKGQILDCNLNAVKKNDYSICIRNLVEIKKEDSPEKFINGLTKVYIMIDKNNGYYKIGRSHNPIYREKTLQSEKPSVELMHAFDARIKDEKIIHDMFCNKRIRGEWFDLSGSDITKIFDYFGVTKN